MEENRIHASRIIQVMEERQGNAPKEFSLTYVKLSSGEMVTYPVAVLTSSHARGSTVNVLIKGERAPRKLRRCLITRLNGLKVYL